MGKQLVRVLAYRIKAVGLNGRFDRIDLRKHRGRIGVGKRGDACAPGRRHTPHPERLFFRVNLAIRAAPQTCAFVNDRLNAFD